MAQDPPKPPSPPQGPSRPVRGGSMQIVRPSSLPPQQPSPVPTQAAAPAPSPAMAALQQQVEMQQAARTGNSLPPRPLPTPGFGPSGPVSAAPAGVLPGGAPSGLPIPGGLPAPETLPADALSPVLARDDAPPAHTPSAPRAAARPAGMPVPGAAPPVTASHFASAPKTPRDELIELHQKLTPRRAFEVVGLTPASPASEVLAGLAKIRARAKELQQSRAVDAATASAVIAKVQEIERFIQDPIEHYVLTRGIQENVDTTSNRDAHRRFEIAFLDTMIPKVVWRSTGEVAGDPRFAQSFPVVAEATVEAPGVTARVPTDELTDSGLVLIGCPIAISTDVRVFLHLQGGTPVPVRCSVESSANDRTKLVFRDVNDQTKAQVKEAIRQYDVAAMRQAERYQMLAPESPIALACLGLSRFLIATNTSERAAARKTLADLEKVHPDHPEVQLAVARAAVDSRDTAEAQRVLRLAKISAVGDRRVEQLVDQVGGDFAVLGATVSRATRLTVKVAAAAGVVGLVIVGFVLLQPAEQKGALEGARCETTEVVGANYVCRQVRDADAPDPAELTPVAQAKLLELRPRGVVRLLVYDFNEKLVFSYPPAGTEPAQDAAAPAEAVSLLLAPVEEEAPGKDDPPREALPVYVATPGQLPAHKVGLEDNVGAAAPEGAPEAETPSVPTAAQVSQDRPKPPKRKPQRKRR